MKKDISEGTMSAEEISKSMTQWYETQLEYLKTTVEEMRGSGREGSQF